MFRKTLRYLKCYAIEKIDTTVLANHIETLYLKNRDKFSPKEQRSIMNVVSKLKSRSDIGYDLTSLGSMSFKRKNARTVVSVLCHIGFHLNRGNIKKTKRYINLIHRNGLTGQIQKNTLKLLRIKNGMGLRLENLINVWGI